MIFYAVIFTVVTTLCFAASVMIWGREPGAWIGLVSSIVLCAGGYLAKKTDGFGQAALFLPFVLVPSVLVFFLVSERVAEHHPTGLWWLLAGSAAGAFSIVLTTKALRYLSRRWKEGNSPHAQQGED